MARRGVIPSSEDVRKLMEAAHEEFTQLRKLHRFLIGLEQSNAQRAVLRSRIKVPKVQIPDEEELPVGVPEE